MLKMNLLPVFVVFNFMTILIFPIQCKSDIATIAYWAPANYATSEQFLSVALDTALIAENFKNFNMTDPKLIKLTKYLSPGYLRIGGKLADRLTFSKDTNASINAFTYYNITDDYTYENIGRDMPNFTMTGEQWIKLNQFSTKVGFKLLFDLNSLKRWDNGSWNSENAKELISFSDEHGFDIDFELGNEPESFPHNFDYNLTASQLAKDFSILNALLKQYPRYTNSRIVGPDTSRPRPEHPGSAKYLRIFLETIQQDVLSAITFHQYYVNAREAVLADFIDPATFNLLEVQLQYGKTIIAGTHLKNTSAWLGETSSAWGGGAPGLSNTFVGCFLWLDKLGLAAKYGVKVVIRQSLFHGSYALLDGHYKPSPDWWLSILYKKLVGPEVLRCNLTTTNTTRLYCQCAAVQDSASPKIAVFGVNINNSTARVQIIVNNNTNNNDLSKNASAYILTGTESSLTSRNVSLNGKVLELTKTGDIPEFQEKIVNISKYLIMPPYSLAFWIIESADATNCSPVASKKV